MKGKVVGQEIDHLFPDSRDTALNARDEPECQAQEHRHQSLLVFRRTLITSRFHSHSLRVPASLVSLSLPRDTHPNAVPEESPGKREDATGAALSKSQAFSRSFGADP